MSIRLQDSHTETIPEVLLTNNTNAWVPSVGIEVVTVSENDKDPC